MNSTRFAPIAVLGFALGLAGCGGESPEPSGQPGPSLTDVAKEAAADADRQGVPVEVLVLETTEFVVRSDYLGNLEPDERVMLTAEVEGAVERLRFEEGDTVAKDAVLAHIATDLLQVRRDQADSDHQLAQAEFVRAETLAEKGLIARAEFDRMRNQRDAARSALRTAEIELRKSVVRSPLAGVVKTRSTAVGEYLSKGTPIAELVSVRRLRARVTVPEAEIRHFEPGKRVLVRLDALPSERFQGTVKRVGIEADPASRTFPVDIEVENPERRMRPGMLARVEVVLARQRDQLMIPRYAIVERDGGRVVFVSNGDNAEERRIEVGGSAGEFVQVTRGLAEGEELIVTGHRRLSAGGAITVTRVLDDAAVAYKAEGP